MRQLSVFLVEDSAPLRARLAAMIGALPGVHIVGEADTPAAALEGLERTRPDCLVLDFHLIGGTGLEVLQQYRPAERGTVSIVLTNYANDAYRRLCLGAGAAHFLDKSTDLDRMAELIAALPARS